MPVLACAAVFSVTSCMKDLEKGNISPTVSDYDQSAMFNKCYAGLIMEGNDGSADFTIDDAGKSTLVRNVYNFNELPTDESICWWSDGGIVELGQNEYQAGHASLKFLYYRLMSNITYCNQYLSVEADYKDGNDERATMYAEVQFLRAYYYYLMLDFFGDPPFVATISSEKPQQASALQAASEGVSVDSYSDTERLKKGQLYMYNWVESQLLDAEKKMKEPSVKKEPTWTSSGEVTNSTGYGRADKAAVWQLLSRLYLNAEVYTGTAQWEKAAEYALKVIDSPYHLFTGSASYATNNYTAYDMLFMGDNGSNGAQCEAVLPLIQDGYITQGWGGSLFFIATHWDATMATVTGQGAGTTGNTWSGMRCRKEFVNKFLGDANNYKNMTAKEIREKLAKSDATKDDRAIFWSKGHTVEVAPNDAFTEGFASPKWNNNYSTGASPHDSYSVDVDFMLFRAAEAWLNYAEAEFRLGETKTAMKYLNQIRERAHARQYQGESEITLEEILDERGRELYLEGLRRPDLIRFGQYGGNQATYQWEYKGGSVNGVNFDSYKNVYPLPTSEISANTNLKQIAGYN